MTCLLNPYLSFSDDARQAMEFYRSVFGGNLDLSTFGEFGAEGSPDADKNMHSRLTTDGGLVLMGAGTPAGMQHESGTNISVSLSGEEAGELRGYWEKLADGGSVSVPLEKQMWGDEFGMCVDRFGIPWMVNIAQPQP